MIASQPAPGGAPSGTNAEQRLEFLDALRGIAALSVVCAHTAQWLWPQYGAFAFSVFDLGNFGVMLFFLCSGFIIPVSLERQNSLTNFWIRRVFRLYPLYWVCIGAILLHGSANGWQGFYDTYHANPWICGAANLTMLQRLFKCDDLLGPSWSLLFEMLFYVFVSFQFQLGLIKKSASMAVLMLLCALLIECVVPLTTGMTLPNGVPGFFATMFVGTVLFRYVNGEIRPGTLVAVLALALFTEVATLLGDINTQEGVWVQWITARLLAYAVFIAFLIGRSRPVPAWLRRLGLISYSLYLVHPYAGFLARKHLPPVVAFCAELCLMLLVAAITYTMIEAPAIRLGRRLTRATKPVQPALEPGLPESVGLQGPRHVD